MRCPGRLPEDEDTLTIRPQPRSAISGIAARMSRIGAITWISHIACHSSSVSASSDRTWLMPAPSNSCFPVVLLRSAYCSKFLLVDPVKHSADRLTSLPDSTTPAGQPVAFWTIVSVAVFC